MPTHINPLRANAEYALLFQPPLGIDDACGQGSREGRGHCNGDNIQCFPHHLLRRFLEKEEDSVMRTKSAMNSSVHVTFPSLLILRNDINGTKGLTMFMALSIFRVLTR